METHWTQTAHLERLWGVVREAPNVAANLPEICMLLGVFWGHLVSPGTPLGSLFAPSLPPGAAFWLPFGTFGGVLGAGSEIRRFWDPSRPPFGTPFLGKLGAISESKFALFF